MCWLLASDDQSMRGSASYYSECSGFISSKIDWFDLFAVQGTLKSLPITAVQNDQFFSVSLLYGPILTSVHDYWKKPQL